MRIAYFGEAYIYSGYARLFPLWILVSESVDGFDVDNFTASAITANLSCPSVEPTFNLPAFLLAYILTFSYLLSSRTLFIHGFQFPPVSKVSVPMALKPAQTQVEDLKDFLELAADLYDPCGLTTYALGDTEVDQKFFYGELRLQAQSNSQVLSRISNLRKGSIVLLCFNDYLDNLEGFWSVLYSGGVPAMSTLFANDLAHRKNRIVHLYDVL